MTIEIRQLIIRASVTSGPEQHPRPTAPSSAAPELPSHGAPDLLLSARQRDALVSACVREVLRKLDKARER